ncbi:secretin N-terminal domain-containing protein [Coraliomargarita sp. SDUM461004]|uniref:Secretin N-terminal domain-containing protein n=1 Tax=Thalassobacterium sedimentorum TaxID=3041258 RepID=A0ABU1AHD2_9BACT|nr:secretin N-terminal domain-containing protein [Coraliomargarita sp. SDUM461004]MDQ8193043.1 secretin N-terminal domain-containing protein [Coraliomargarita sp. SDUM461004]
MKKHTHYSLWLLAPIVLWAQTDEPALVDIDLSDVIVVEDAAGAEAIAIDAPVELVEPPETPVEVEVVEIPDAPIEGASIDEEAPMIPVVTESLPTDMEIVLEIPGQEASAPGEATLASEETISVDFPDEDVRTILRNVADLFELNLVIPDTLQGRTSIKLRNITWGQAFEVVLGPLGYTYVEDRNIIRIKSVEELTTEPVDTRVFIANYARAQDLQGSIAPLIDNAAGGRIQVDVRSNALVITERPSRMNKIQEIIERLDKATDQVMIESKFIEITNTDTKNLGVNWASLSGYSASAGPFQREWSRERSSTNTTTSGTIDDAGVNSDDGVTYDNGTTFSDTITNVASTSRLDTALFSADQFEVILSALNTQDDIKLVSNPTVVTLNNTQAKIAIGERYPIPEYTFNAETGQRQLDEINYEDIGINLDVTPQVNSAGFINLKIIPEVSSSDRFALIENTEIPIIESRRTETTIMIKDGYTLAIGGLVEDGITKRDTKVPVLGNLPGVGRLFSSESDEVTQRNLIIFITAKTLNPDGSTYRDIIDPRVIDRMGIVPSELPGYNLSAEEQELMDQLDAYRIEADQQESIEAARQQIKAIEYRKAQEAREVIEETPSKVSKARSLR